MHVLCSPWHRPACVVWEIPAGARQKQVTASPFKNQFLTSASLLGLLWIHRNPLQWMDRYSQCQRVCLVYVINFTCQPVWPLGVQDSVLFGVCLWGWFQMRFPLGNGSGLSEADGHPEMGGHYPIPNRTTVRGRRESPFHPCLSARVRHPISSSLAFELGFIYEMVTVLTIFGLRLTYISSFPGVFSLQRANCGISQFIW